MTWGVSHDPLISAMLQDVVYKQDAGAHAALLDVMTDRADAEPEPLPLIWAKCHTGPMWLSQRIWAARRANGPLSGMDLDSKATVNLVRTACAYLTGADGGWIDHYGKGPIVEGQKPAFLSEPYDLGVNRLRCAGTLAVVLNLPLFLSRRAAHNAYCWRIGLLDWPLVMGVQAVTWQESEGKP